LLKNTNDEGPHYAGSPVSSYSHPLGPDILISTLFSGFTTEFTEKFYRQRCRNYVTGIEKAMMIIITIIFREMLT
jgi:hypothetical protein